MEIQVGLRYPHASHFEATAGEEAPSPTRLGRGSPHYRSTSLIIPPPTPLRPSEGPLGIGLL